MTRYKQFMPIILIVFLVLAIISFLVITSPNRTSTTPGLIQRAYDRGEITEEYRLLYLTYAFYEPESLPARFQGKVPWEGTFVNRYISPSMLCFMSPHVYSEIRRLLNPDTICD